MRSFIPTVVILLYSISAFANGFRGGEISYEYLGSNTFRFHVYIYSIPSVSLDSIEVNYSDGDVDVAHLNTLVQASGINIADYFVDHTFSGTGIYQVYVENPNWISGIMNIVSSLNEVCAVACEVNLFSGLSANTSPQFSNSHLNVVYNSGMITHTLNMTDPDSDSLSYELTPAFDFSAVYLPVPVVYNYPQTVGGGSCVFTSGVLQMAVLSPGNYVCNLKIQEWRSGVQIGWVSREMIVTYSGSAVYEVAAIPIEFYPNPFTVVVHINGSVPGDFLNFYSLTGQLLQSMPVNPDGSVGVPAQFQSGNCLAVLYDSQGKVKLSQVLMKY